MQTIEKIIYPVIDTFNELHGQSEWGRLQKSPDCPLYGENACMDSMALVTFIIKVQQYVQERENIYIELATEKALSRVKKAGNESVW